MRISLEDVVNIDYSKVIESIRSYVEEVISESGASEVVLGLSGGLDSSVSLKLLVEILGADKVVALIMPDSRVTPIEDIEDAVSLASKTGVKYYLVYIDRIVDSYSVAPFYDPEHRLATGNLRARIRANLLYYYANKHRALVMGTGDRSEVLIGYFTKYGDGAADFYPIACLYKSQVRVLGKILGVPERSEAFIAVFSSFVANNLW